MTTGFALEEKMMPYIRSAIGEIPSKYFFDIDKAPIERDQKEATDLIIKLSGGDVAVRVRRYKYKYKDNKPLAFDWSVRWRSMYGNKTEIDKLREGFARWYFYAIANERESGLFEFCLIDVDKVRETNILNDKSKWQIYPNGDGSMGGYFPARKLNELGCILWPVISVQSRLWGE